MPKITAENAREFARRSHAAQAAERERLKLAALASVPADLSPVEPSFEQECLARVRRQIRMVASMIDAERDPARLDRLTAAALRLSEMERKLAGRPDPGHLRPGPIKRASTHESCDPLPPS